MIGVFFNAIGFCSKRKFDYLLRFEHMSADHFVKLFSVIFVLMKMTNHDS